MISTCVQPLMLVLPVQLQSHHLSSDHHCQCWCVSVGSMGFLLPAIKGNSNYEWWSAYADFFRILSQGQGMFFPRACHSLSDFLWIDISVMWQFHKFWKSVLREMFFKVLMVFAIFFKLPEMWSCLGYCRWDITIYWYSGTSMFSALALSLQAWVSCAAFIGTRQHELPSVTRYWDLS